MNQATASHYNPVPDIRRLLLLSEQMCATLELAEPDSAVLDAGETEREHLIKRIFAGSVDRQLLAKFQAPLQRALALNNRLIRLAEEHRSRLKQSLGGFRANQRAGQLYQRVSGKPC